MHLKLIWNAHNDQCTRVHFNDNTHDCIGTMQDAGLHNFWTRNEQTIDSQEVLVHSIITLHIQMTCRQRGISMEYHQAVYPSFWVRPVYISMSVLKLVMK